MTLHTYDVTIHYDDTRLTQPVQAENMIEAAIKAIRLVRNHRAATEARRLYIERRGA